MTTIKELLRGCEPGRMQTVGIMQVIPLLSDMETASIVSPARAQVSTTDYGTMVVNNPTDSTMLVPTHAAYMTEQKAQDHAMAHAGFVKKSGRAQWKTAMCIQQTQAGMIDSHEGRMTILPMSLREKALAGRKNKTFSRLWDAIQNLHRETGCYPASGNLIEFMERFQTELDQFVAEFEILPKQVGAIVLIGGKVMGIERSPSQQYFADIWQALIRECYGSEAIRQAKTGAARQPRAVQVRSVRDLNDLRAALDEARGQDEERAREIVRGLIEDPFERSEEGSAGRLDLVTVSNNQFVGQVVQEGERVHYASLVTTRDWTENADWREAKAFSI